MSVVVFVLLLVGAIALANALVWLPVVRWMRRRREAATTAVADELAASGETIVRGPEDGLYRGGTGSHSQVAGNARVLLTDRRLIIVKTSGGRVTVERASIRAADERTTFLGRTVAGSRCVVVSMADGSEVGVVVADPAAWVAAMSS